MPSRFDGAAVTEIGLIAGVRGGRPDHDRRIRRRRRNLRNGTPGRGRTRVVHTDPLLFDADDLITPQRSVAI